MKQIKTLLLGMALTTVLAGNIFATGGVLPATSGIVTYALTALLALSGGNDQCPLRQCTTCKPNNEGGDNGNGDCRPTPD
jgi:hypothetical protein